MKKYLLIILIGSLILTISCAELTLEKNQLRTDIEKFSLSKEFKSQWFDGKAELTSYRLKKARYGEIRDGEAVMIFVTEPFLAEQQVKYEGYSTSEKPGSVLKLNFHQTFNTGVYPYSILTSVFSPLNPYESALKVSTSTQEWCGHTFIQMNNRDQKYEVNSLSYFQKESDSKYEIDKAVTEDEIWTKIRISPDKLPIGNIKIIPGTSISRLHHFDLDVQNAKAELSDDEGIRSYKITYEDIERTLDIKFEAQSPFKILGWQENIVSSGKNLVTTATINKSIDLDYWNKNSVADSTYRTLLGLQ